jgi:hypothetical protein
MDNDPIRRRLARADPGWPEWTQLQALVTLSKLEKVECPHTGVHFSSQHLSFSDSSQKRDTPQWLPLFAHALYGLKASSWEYAGGYGDAISNGAVTANGVFSLASNDCELGYPLIPPPEDAVYFQTTDSGGVVFLNRNLQMLAPDVETKSVVVFDDLESFTKNHITSALAGKPWHIAYDDRLTDLVD